MKRDTRASSTRPPSAVPVPRTTAVPAVSRPITQQGLSGLRPIQTADVLNRIYHDKRYWMSLIQTQTNKIQEEMARMKKENEEFRMRTTNIEDLKKSAQEHAKKIEEQQEHLGVYNNALEMYLSKTKENEIIIETEQIKHQNEMKFKEIDNLFNERLRLQEKILKMKKNLDEHDYKMNLLVEELTEDDRLKYYSIVAEKEKLLKEVLVLQAKIKESNEKIENCKGIISKSSEKQEKLQLFQTQNHLEAQKQELTAFLQNTLTPTQQREALLQQVKQDKADIETFTKLKVTLEEECAFKTERMHEIERELDDKDNARLKKHRELRQRGEHMDAFIDGYEQKAIEIESKIKVSRDKILLVLDHIANNVAEIDLDEFGKMQIDSGEASLDGWNKRCSLLASQLKRLNLYEERFKSEISNLRQKQVVLLEEVEDFQNIDRKRDQMNIEKNHLTVEETTQTTKLESTQAAVFEIQRQKMDIVKQLEENPSYHEIVSVEKKIEELENKHRDAEDILNSEKQNNLTDKLSRSVDELLKKRNEQVIAGLKQRKK